jgi:hypothetical protein
LVDLLKSSIECADQRFKAAVDGREQLLIRHTVTLPRSISTVKKIHPA